MIWLFLSFYTDGQTAGFDSELGLVNWAVLQNNPNAFLMLPFELHIQSWIAFKILPQGHLQLWYLWCRKQIDNRMQELISPSSSPVSLSEHSAYICLLGYVINSTHFSLRLKMDYTV